MFKKIRFYMIGNSYSSAVETITWEARDVRDSTPEVIAGGSKVYTPETDIIVQQRSAAAEVWWRKSLDLDDTFTLAAAVYRRPTLSGFGLVVSMGGRMGFSWEWFQLKEGNIFRKLQGCGEVAVGLHMGPDFEELESVEFLDDIALRYLDNISKPPGTHTHEIIIRRGSVLRLGPAQAVDESQMQERIGSGRQEPDLSPQLPGSRIVPPVALERPIPSYTEEARKAGIEGIVLLNLVVDSNGLARDFTVVRGLGYGLDESAIETIARKWRFRPGTFAGKPVNVQITVQVAFRLYHFEDASPSPE